jgi:pyrroloquinoline quinone (PQQ) biosynthesis protein C
MVTLQLLNSLPFILLLSLTRFKNVLLSYVKSSQFFVKKIINYFNMIIAMRIDLKTEFHLQYTYIDKWYYHLS